MFSTIQFIYITHFAKKNSRLRLDQCFNIMPLYICVINLKLKLLTNVYNRQCYCRVYNTMYVCVGCMCAYKYITFEFGAADNRNT